MNKRDINKFRKDYTPWSFERFRLTSEVTLAVSFDEKDDIRNRYSARWDPNTMMWWMSTTAGSSVTAKAAFDYLNNLKALYCPRGIADIPAVEQAIFDVESNGHRIYCTQTGNHRVFDHYPSLQLTRIDYGSDNPNSPIWVPEDQARLLWNEFMEDGFRRCYNTTPSSAQEIEEIR